MSSGALPLLGPLSGADSPCPIIASAGWGTHARQLLARGPLPTGYKVVRVTFEKGKPRGVEDFATGWLQGGGHVSGRPVDLLVGRDGALYLSSDQFALEIYRVTYRP